MAVTDVDGFEKSNDVTESRRDAEKTDDALTATVRLDSASHDAANRANTENDEPQGMPNQDKCKCWGPKAPKTCKCGSHERLTFEPFCVDDEKCKEEEKDDRFFFQTEFCSCWVVTGFDKNYKAEVGPNSKQEYIVKCAPDDIDESDCNRLGCVYIEKMEGSCWDMDNPRNDH